MELWIRSQDKEALIKVDKIFYWNTCPEMSNTGKHYLGNKEWVGNADYTKLGEYKTKERTLEILGEIQNAIKGKYIVECHPIMKTMDLINVKESFEKINDISCIVSDSRTEIKPISDCIVYEMPEE